MGRMIIRRLVVTLPMLLGITFLSFALMHLAGGDVVTQRMEASGIALSAEQIAAERARLGLDRPFLVQYFAWLGDFLQGDLGVSVVSGADVFETFLSKLPATLFLTGSAMLLTVVIAVPLGILAAVKQDGVIDCVLRGMSFVAGSLPNFFVALVLMMIFAIKLPLFPVISTGDNLASAVLPTLTLAICMSAKYLRQVRAAVLEELAKPYVLGAKARGVPFRRVLFKGVLRSALGTLVTLFALSAGSLLGGCTIVETIFMWDGVGKLAVDAISMRDYPVIQAYVAWMAIIYVLVNLLADICQYLLDPRMRLGEGARL